MRRVLVVCIFLVAALFGGNVHADGTVEEGLSAYERGDYQEALRLLRPLAESGNAGARNAMGRMYELGAGVGQDMQAAVHWFELAAKSGDARGQNNLGVMYLLGQGVKQSPEIGGRWFRLAAGKGLAVAQYNLALLYDEGLGVPKSYGKALIWYRRAAAQDLQPAQRNLALMYAFGRGVAVNYATAVELLRRPAAHGYAPAQNDLGMMHLNGLGVPKDLVIAHLWFALAAEQGDRAALLNYVLIEADMTPEQIAEAEALFRAWKGNGGMSHRNRETTKHHAERTCTAVREFLQRRWNDNETRVTSVSCG